MRPLLAMLLLCACASEEAPPGSTPTMAASEQERGVQLCQGYADRICACAGTDLALKDQCELARGTPDAVKLHIGMLRRKKLAEGDRLQIESALRKTVAACVNADGLLDPKTCPRR
jgi:hypothetical protein